MEPQQLKKVLVPVLAIAGVMLLVGLILLIGNDSPDPAKPKSQTNTNNDTDDMSKSLPPVDGPEWKDIGAGLKIWDVKDGDGEAAPEGATVSMHYTGWLPNGEVFDSSVTRGDPLNMSLGRLIPGWQKGIPGMKPGGIRRLYIPFDLGYGPRGSPPKIPPNTDLIFEVKLLKASR